VHLLTRYSLSPVAMREYRGGMSANQFRRTIDFIEANLGKNFGLAELAANVRMSPDYFCRLFKQSTSFSPHQFLIRKRIEHARRMQRSTSSRRSRSQPTWVLAIGAISYGSSAAWSGPPQSIFPAYR